jgi:hypothetical protein
MALSKDDRVAFSLKIVSAAAEVAGLDAAKAALGVQIAVIQKLDTANKNLFDPTNALVTAYQGELSALTGVAYTTIVEQDIQDAASKKLQNHFFPNDTTATVPSLSGLHNVWPRVQPFALTYSIGKNYSEGNGTTSKEADLIGAINTLITAAGTHLDIENTSGQHVDPGTGTCSLSGYATEAACLAATPTPGVWTPGTATIVDFMDVITLKTNLMTAVSNLKSFLQTEVALIPTDPNQQANNTAAINNINNVIIPALDAWTALPAFNPVPNTVTAATFPTYNAALLAPTKLYSGNLSTLQTALNTRSTFVSTRVTQLQSVLGTIVQDVNTGNITSQTGLYGKRYGYMLLRLNALGGSLTQLAGLSVASGAQDSIKANTIATKATYFGIVPTSLLQASASGSNQIQVVDTTFLSPGDIVYIYAENQDELVRGIKSISGQLVTLSDVVPGKYTTSTKARIYKDLS